jgi:hypothetical protein
VSTGKSSPLAAALRTSFRQPAFVAAVVVLFVAALTLNGATRYMKLYFKKEPVSLRRELDTLPTQLGPWLQVSRDEPLDKELEDTLGTKRYIFRDYVDVRQLADGERAALTKEQSTKDYQNELGRFRAAKPTAVLTAAVTYYTGMVDTVAHIPDRCYVADGFEPSEYTSPTWDVTPHAAPGSYASAPTRQMQVRFINFEDQTPGRMAAPINVAYFFQCNGSYESDPINGVRFRLQNLTEKHGYYAKVELKTVMRDSQAAQATMTDFLRSALPEIERCLPDWEAVRRDEASSISHGAATVP